MDKDRLNPAFAKLEVDYLYHLGLDSAMNLQEQFGDIKYVVFTRFSHDADLFSSRLCMARYQIHDSQINCATIAKSERYHIFKVAQTLIISHGIGAPSLLICLNEVVKLLYHAKVDNPLFFRLGPAGGLGVAPGQVVLGNAVLSPDFKTEWKNIEFGQYQTYATEFSKQLIADIIKVNATLEITSGKILSTYSFYNGQARLNGALKTSYDEKERNNYLERAYQLGVRAIELESACFAAFCHNLAIPAAVVLQIISDRLTDQDREPLLRSSNSGITKAEDLIINYILANKSLNSCN